MSLSGVVCFPSVDGLDTLVGIVQGCGDTLDTVVLCHGLGNDKESFVVKQLSKRLGRRFRTLRFDFRGNGASSGSFAFGGYDEQALDIEAAVKFLESEGLRVIGVLGHSMGGDSALMFGALSPLARDKRLVNVSGRFQMDRGLREKFSDAQWSALCAGESIEWPLKDRSCKVTMNDVDKRRRTDMKGVVEKIAERGDVFVLTVHGSEDDVIPVEDAHEIHKILSSTGRHELVILEGANHFYKTRGSSDTSQIESLFQVVSAFLD